MHEVLSQTDWRSLFDRHAAGLILFARQWCRSHADAEDVVQEIFVDRWKRAAEADDPAAYLYTCVRFSAMDQRRAQGRRLGREQSVARDKDLAEQEACFESSLIDQERAAMIEAQLMQLPTNQREVVVLKIWGELTFAQIGQVVDASPHTVASRYRYAIQALRQTMTQELMT